MQKTAGSFLRFSPLPIMEKKTYSKDYKKIIEGLHPAWEELRKHPRKDTAGNDNETINTFSKDYSSRISSLNQKLLDGTFKFSPLKRAEVDKGREILIPTVEERIVTLSMLKAIFPRLEDLNSNLDFSRKSRYLDPEEDIPEFDGTPLAVEKIQTALKSGYVWVLEADIKGFFDHVPKDKVFNLIKRKIKNKKVLELIKQIVYFKVTTSKDPKAKQYNNLEGIAQGSSLSPILASVYMYDFDMYVSKMKDVRLIRYVDDFVVLCKDEATAKKMYRLVQSKLKKMGLDMYTLDEVSSKGAVKTKITLAKGYGSKSFDFLGLTFNYLDVDISQKKKDDIDKKIKEIIQSGKKPNLLQKMKSLESRLNGYIDHYRKAHYSRTVASLNKIINYTQSELRSYYIVKYRKITSKNPFHKITPPKIEQLFQFMGIDFNHLIIKTNTPPKNKDKK